MSTTAELSLTMDIVMLSLKICQDILNKNGKKYSEAEIKIIREHLTKLSLIEYEFYQEEQRIPKDKESSHLHESVDGGTSDSRIQLGVSGGST
jgi:hypothetical protein